MEFRCDANGWAASCGRHGVSKQGATGMRTQSLAAQALTVSCLEEGGGYIDLGDVFVVALPNLFVDSGEYTLAFGPYVEGGATKTPNVRKLRPFDVERDYLLTEKLYGWDGALVQLVPEDLRFVIELVGDLKRFSQIGDQRLRMRAVMQAKAAAESYRGAYTREEDDPGLNGAAPFFASMMASLAQGRRSDMLRAMAGLVAVERQAVLSGVFSHDAQAVDFGAEELNGCVWGHIVDLAARMRELRAVLAGSPSTIKVVRTEAGAWTVSVSNSVLLGVESVFETPPSGHGYTLLDAFSSLWTKVAGERLLLGFGYAGAKEVRISVGRQGVSSILDSSAGALGLYPSGMHATTATEVVAVEDENVAIHGERA